MSKDKGYPMSGSKKGGSGTPGVNENNTGKQFFHNRTKRDNSLEGLPSKLDVSRRNQPS